MWKKVPGTAYDMSGEAGDTINFTVGSTSTDYVWTAANWAWTLEARPAVVSSTTATASRPPAGTDTYSTTDTAGAITDNSTTSVLALTVKIPAATTASWAGTYIWALRGVHSTYGTITFIPDARFVVKSPGVT